MPMSNPVNVFVYGLLMFPEIVTAITGQQYRTLSAVLPHHQRRGLSQSPGSAPIPVLIDNPEVEQDGLLLLEVDETAMAKLDFFEELDSGLYVKKQVRVQAAGQWYYAICYAAGPALLPYVSGDWLPSRINAEQKAYFIQTVIPDMLRAMQA
jgi:hypothetical protein